MKILGNTLLIAAGLFALAGIWIPENWWQLLATSIVLLFAAASILGQQAPRKGVRPHDPNRVWTEDNR